MNKKGIFLPLFVISTLFILGLLFASITYEKNERQDKEIGQNALAILKSYDEGEKINLFFEQSVKYTEKKTISDLYSNAGYSSENSCEKIGEFIIFSQKCGEFNPQKYFQESLNKELEQYNYLSTYKEIENKKVFGSRLFTAVGLLPEVETSKNAELFKFVAEKNAKLKIENLENQGNEFIINFRPVELLIENPSGIGEIESTYTLTPKIKVENNILFLENFHRIISENCKDSIEECEAKLKIFYSNVNIQKENNLLKIIIPKGNYQLKAALDITKGFPNKLSFRAV